MLVGHWGGPRTFSNQSTRQRISTRQSLALTTLRVLCVKVLDEEVLLVLVYTVLPIFYPPPPASKPFRSQPPPSKPSRSLHVSALVGESKSMTVALRDPPTSSLVRKRPRAAPVTNWHRYRASYRPHAGLMCDQTKLYLFFSRLNMGPEHVMDFSELPDLCRQPQCHGNTSRNSRFRRWPPSCRVPRLPS